MSRGVVLQAHSDLPSFATCGDCPKGETRADYAILVKGQPDWKYVCEPHSYEYDWDNAEIAGIELDYDVEEDKPG